MSSRNTCRKLAFWLRSKGIDPGEAVARQRELRVWPLAKLIGHLAHGGDEIEHIVFRTYGRTTTLRWVYEDSGLVGSTAFVRLPSHEKTRLVNELCDWFCRRNPARHKQQGQPSDRSTRWMSSRVLHAMAFAPEWFSKHKRSASTKTRRDWYGESPVPSPSQIKDWGPLYSLRRVPKGHGRFRVLHVPNPPLRRVQRIILKALGRNLAKSIPRHVHGVSGSIFKNANSHIGQKFIVTMDLKDFFPSVRWDMLVRGLLKTGEPMLPESLPENTLNGSEKPLKWTTDSAVLIARLCTHRGRLPQGAPTSPLMANIAFRAMDDRLCKALGTDVVYTRYFDDLTVSISGRLAQKEGIESEKQFRAHVESRVKGALSGSGFSLNDRKTRAYVVVRGALVTGLRVDQRNVALPREFRRRIRSITHSIRGNGFVAAATKHYGQEAIAGIRDDGNIRGHRSQGCKLSIEQLAEAMLRQVAPHLLLRFKHSPYASERLQDEGHTDYIGKLASRYVGRILGEIWRGNLKSKLVRDNTLRIDSNDGEYCSVEGSQLVHLLRLARRDAIKCVLYWHRLQGLCAFLNGCDRDPCFDQVRDQHDRLTNALDSIVIKAPEDVAPQVLKADAEQPRVTQEERVEEVLKKLEEHLIEFAKHIETQLPAADLRKVTKCVKSESDLQTWLQATAHLVTALPKLPSSAREGNADWPRPHGLEAIVLIGDFTFGHRRRDYVSLSDVIDLPSPLKKQEYLAKSALDTLRAVQEQRRTGGHDRCERLVDSRFHRNHDGWRNDLVKQFCEVHDDLVKRGILSISAGKELSATHAVLSKPCEGETTSRLWDELYEFAEVFVKSVEEQAGISGKEFREKLGKGHQLSRKARILSLMRNQHAHGESGDPKTSKEREKNRAAIHRDCARATLREDPGTDELRLTKYEANEIKCVMLQWMVAVVEKMRGWSSSEAS